MIKDGVIPVVGSVVFCRLPGVELEYWREPWIPLEAEESVSTSRGICPRWVE